MPSHTTAATGPSRATLPLLVTMGDAAGIGPEIGCQFTVARAQWSANLRAYGEFGARNRYEGYALFATLNIPLTSAQ